MIEKIIPQEQVEKRLRNQPRKTTKHLSHNLKY